ncbi:histidine kinase [Corallococcus sp. H22C18031201]|uniref:GAF domain-containing sensor histidine kinase n=1 Tax=Citreicoccus inhibens TaxID=2849499 RepID=UPI000E74A1BF|nr:ATP-binding protein [Citreicoccus inhibens]MBU8895909.1 PAS domain S-box protein [Citreicoccus inhibens]RJS23907.1 histidine kinase [Corallococcus sp. H22C18031201]
MSQEQRETGRFESSGDRPEPFCTGCARAVAPDALNEPAARVRAHLSSALLREVIFELDGDGRLGFVGIPWEHLVGSPAALWQGRPLVEIFDPEDRDTARALLEAARTRAPLPVRRELRLDGGVGVRWVELSATGVPGGAGDVVGTLVDVTARRRAEDAATTRERYLEAVVEVQRRLLAPEPSGALYDAILEPLGQVSGASRAYVFEFHRDNQGRLLQSQRAEWCAPGISRELDNPDTQNFPVDESFRAEQSVRLWRGEAVQGVPWDFAPGIAPVLAEQGIQSLLILPLWVHGELFGFIGFDNCDGGRAWSPMEVNLLSGAAGALSLALEQRTADALRVRTEATLRRTEAGFHLLIEGFPDPVVVHAAGGTLLSANPAMVLYLGYQDPAELLGRNLLELVRPEDREAARRHLSEAQDGSLAARAQEVPLQCRDGSVVVADLVTLGVLFDGAPARVTVARDFTERKRVQAQLMLGDRMASMGMLAAGIAHELNNPLAYVLSNLEFLNRALGGLPRALAVEDLVECRQVLDDARDGAERMRQIVRQLKVFSRVDDAHEEPVDVHRVLDSVTQMAASEIRPRARLVKEYGAVPPVRGNEGKLFQVFLNLVINAAHSIDEGRMEANEIRLVTREDAQGRVLVDVRDTGRGIAPEHLRRIFDPFFTTKAPGLGTGLGLSICDTIVRALGGLITVESALGVGTTFRVVLESAASHAVRVA